MYRFGLFLPGLFICLLILKHALKIKLLKNKFFFIKNFKIYLLMCNLSHYIAKPLALQVSF